MVTQVSRCSIDSSDTGESGSTDSVDTGESV